MLATAKLKRSKYNTPGNSAGELFGMVKWPLSRLLATSQDRGSKGHELNDLAMNLSYCWWQKSGDHQLRLVVYPIIYQVSYIQPVVGLGISEHQQYQDYHLCSHILRILISRKTNKNPVEAGAEDALVWRDGDPRATEISLSSDGHLTVVRHLWW